MSAGRSERQEREFNDAPAAAGDLAASLARWEASRRRRAHPHAAIHCARLLALTGKEEAGLRLALRALPDEGDATALLVAAQKFFVPGLAEAWVRALDRLRRTPAWREPARGEALARLLKADALLTLGDAARAMALAVLGEAQGAALGQGNCVMGLIAAAAFGPPGAGAALAGAIAAPAAAVTEAARMLARRHAEGVVPFAGLPGFAREFAAHPEAMRMLVSRLAAAATPRSAFELLLAAPQTPCAPGERRRAVAWALTAEPAWSLARRVALAGHPALAPLAEEVAAQAGDAAQALAGALARSLPSAGDAAAAQAALDGAERLALLGWVRLAAAVLEPWAATSEPAAFRRAELLGRVAPEGRTAAAWRAGAQAHGSLRLRRGLAIALAEEGEAAAAEALYQDTVPEGAPVEAWRPWAGTLERMGAHAAWAALVERLEAQAPGHEWLAGERLKLALETRRAPAAPPGPGPGSGGPHARRAAIRALTVAGRLDEAAQAQRALAALTGEAGDHHGLLVALCGAGAFEEAAAQADRLLGLFPGDYRNWLKRAQLHERLGEDAAALRCFARSLDVEPGNRDGLAGVPRCLAWLGEEARAAAWLDGVPGDGPALTWREAMQAFLLARQGRTDAAARRLRAARAMARRGLGAIEAWLEAGEGRIWAHGRPHEGASPRVEAARRAFAADVAWLRRGRVVVVGNSPRLLGCGLGAAIDGFDRVVRLNDFRTEGHEADVGARTDLWFSSANRLARPNIRAWEGLRVWLSQPNPQHMPDPGSFGAGRLGLDLSSARAGFLPPHIHSLSTCLAYPRPSTGFRVVTMLALLLGVPCATAGFGFFEDAALHYFDQGEGRLQVGEVHSTRFERDFTRQVLALLPGQEELG